MIAGPILLTGAGGDIGIALARVLREALPGAAIIGADCDAGAVGAEFVDSFHTLPRADAPDFLAALESLIAVTGARHVIPLAEAELARLSAEDMLAGELAGAAIISANATAVRTGLDKLVTAQVLGQAGLAVPESGIVGEDEPGHFDCIIKPRSGQGSKGLRFVARGEFDALAGDYRGNLWQRWLKDEASEYTCGVARFGAKATRSLCFRRRLQGGLTGRGEVVHDARLTLACEQVAEALDLEGSINIQLRMDAGTPVIFEINPRFSSTVGFRHRLGFTDAIWAIKARLGLDVGAYTPPVAGTRIERVAHEVIRPPAAC
ncbi:ATP-grasp domain-containing protein [uncultured Erythrobacter sp.]|uniref:ATP-grasp domain-containing protein n=1 Tax=uncultured Erythrobacter sp. TaxID=263913 RepID=UPI00261E758F|nr:ATP-grasp domain-containing protein [uncultured Erythrobacter sp.]